MFNSEMSKILTKITQPFEDLASCWCLKDHGPSHKVDIVQFYINVSFIINKISHTVLNYSCILKSIIFIFFYISS